MNNQNSGKGSGRGLVLIGVPVMIVCCAAPVLLASGVLGGVLAWFSDGGAVTIGLAAVVGAVGVYLYKTKVARWREDHSVEASHSE